MTQKQQLARETWGTDKNTYCDLGGAVEVRTLDEETFSLCDVFGLSILILKKQLIRDKPDLISIRNRNPFQKIAPLPPTQDRGLLDCCR